MEKERQELNRLRRMEAHYKAELQGFDAKTRETVRLRNKIKKLEAKDKVDNTCQRIHLTQYSCESTLSSH